PGTLGALLPDAAPHRRTAHRARRRQLHQVLEEPLQSGAHRARDWGLTTLSAQDRADLLEIFDDRIDTGSTLIASQLPVDTWHAYLGEPTLADSILDRLVHQSHRIDLKLPGESMRKNRATGDAGASPRPDSRLDCAAVFAAEQKQKSK